MSLFIDETQFGTHPTPRSSATWPFASGKTTFETMGDHMTFMYSNPQKKIER